MVEKFGFDKDEFRKNLYGFECNGLGQRDLSFMVDIFVGRGLLYVDIVKGWYMSMLEVNGLDFENDEFFDVWGKILFEIEKLNVIFMI